MARTKKIYKIVDDVEQLSKRAMEVDGALPPKVVLHDINAIKSTLKLHPEIVALCGPQLGIKTRIFCIRFANNTIKTFVNPMIIKSEGLHLSREINASFKEEYIVLRNDKIIAMYTNEKGGIEENRFEGAPAEVFQQMAQMLDGILLPDFGMEVMPGFDEATDAERQEVLEMYVDHIKSLDEKLADEIENDKVAKDIKGAIDFYTALATGKVDLVAEDKDGNLDFEHSPGTELKKMEGYEKQRLEAFNKKFHIDEKIKASMLEKKKSK